MIVTESIKLTSKELFNIYIVSYLKKRWWMVAWIWIAIVLLLFRQNNDSFGYFIVAALVLIQLMVVYQYWGFAKSKDIQDRYYEIDSDKIVGKSANGMSTTIEIGSLVNVVKASKYYLLYTTKIEFIYLPIVSFKRTEDIEWFEREIIVNIKK